MRGFALKSSGCWYPRCVSAAPGVSVAVLLITLWSAGACEAQPGPLPDPAGLSELPRLEIPDAGLVDQDGRAVRVHDLLVGRRVAINFIFTTCTTICPPMGANFARLQRDLEARGDNDVAFVSVSIDPVTDTPDRLAAWAARFRGSGEWTLLTGEKAEIDSLLKELGVFTPSIEDHAPVLLLGSEPQGRWFRAYGLAPPADLVRALEELRPPAGEPQSPVPPPQ